MSHRFSIGFKSGDNDGQGKTLIFCDLNQARLTFARWTGALSCWKIHSDPPKLSAMLSKCFLSTSRYPFEFIRRSVKHIELLPPEPNDAQIMTLPPP